MTVHSVNLRTAQLVAAVFVAVCSIIGTSLSVTWWAIGPRLNAHIDERVARSLAPRVIESQKDIDRLRLEFAREIATEQQARRETIRALETQMTRIEASLTYITERVDRILERGAR